MSKDKKNNRKKTRLIEPNKNFNELWQLHRNIGQLADHLNRLPNAGEIRKRKLKSAPLNVTGMVF